MLMQEEDFPGDPVAASVGEGVSNVVVTKSVGSGVGAFVGGAVTTSVGIFVGGLEGAGVGPGVGTFVGGFEGTGVGLGVGSAV